MDICMIHYKNLASTFWGEEINCANYIQDRMPHKALQNMTPMEAWTHEKPDVYFLRVFGSPTWALILDEKLKAMEKKIQQLRFVGYYEDMKAYRLLDPNSKEFLLRRDVNFDENISPRLYSSPNTSYSIIDYSSNHFDSFIYLADEEISTKFPEPEENILSTPAEPV